MNRRYGRFSLHREAVERATPEITRIMGSCSIIRAEYHMIDNRVHYHAISFRFREVNEGEIAPEYVWLFNTAGDMWCEEAGY